MPWDKPVAAVLEPPVQEVPKPPREEVHQAISTSVPRTADLSALQNYLKRTLEAKPAVAAYLGQARKWEVEGEVLKIWFDNQVAFNLVKPEALHFSESLGKVAMGVKNVEIMEWEEDTGPVPDLDDFDRQVDLIAQVFRGERIQDKTEGEKK